MFKVPLVQPNFVQFIFGQYFLFNWLCSVDVCSQHGPPNFLGTINIVSGTYCTYPSYLSTCPPTRVVKSSCSVAQSLWQWVRFGYVICCCLQRDELNVVEIRRRRANAANGHDQIAFKSYIQAHPNTRIFLTLTSLKFALGTSAHAVWTKRLVQRRTCFKHETFACRGIVGVVEAPGEVCAGLLAHWCCAGIFCVDQNSLAHSGYATQRVIGCRILALAENITLQCSHTSQNW